MVYTRIGGDEVVVRREMGYYVESKHHLYRASFYPFFPFSPTQLMCDEQYCPTLNNLL